MPERREPEEITLEDLMGIPERTLTDQELPLIRYRPTLIIGAGGTGARVVRKIKRRVRRFFPRERWEAFQYLAIDADDQDDPERGEDRLDEHEFFYIPNFHSGDFIDVLGEPTGDPNVAAWWPRTANGDWYRVQYSGDGAKQERALGRLCLVRNVVGIRAKIRSKIREAITITESLELRSQGIKVYIVGSLAGGTGAGMMLDLAYITRFEIAKEAQLNIYVTGMLVLPDAYTGSSQSRYEENHMQANAYAALMEINHFMSKREYRVRYTSDYEVRFRSGAVQPFDVAYIVGLNGPQQRLGSVDDLSEMLALYMVGEILSPAGSRLSSRLDNLGTSAIIGGHPAAFSSLAYASVLYPQAGLAAYFALKDSTYLIRDVLLPQGTAASNVEEDVKAVISGLRLDEDPGDQLTEELKSRSGAKIEDGQISLDDVAGTHRDDMEGEVQRRETTIRRWITESRHLLRDIQPVRQAEARADIVAETHVVLTDPERGFRYADYWLAELEKRLQAFLDAHMLKEQDAFAEQVSGAESRLSQAKDRLSRAINPQSVMDYRFSLQPGSHFNACIANLNELALASFDRETRQQAAATYQTLVADVRKIRQDVRQAIDRLETEADRRHTMDAQARFSMTAHSQTFALTRSVVGQQRIQALYDSITLFPNRDPIHHDRRVVTSQQRVDLSAGFWRHLAQRNNQWRLDGTAPRVEQLVRATWSYVADQFRTALSDSTLLTEVRESLGDSWTEQLRNLINQARPFWPLSAVDHVEKVEEGKFEVRLVGYGEDPARWRSEVGNVLGGVSPDVYNNASTTEMTFVFTEHARPLYHLGPLRPEGRYRVSYDHLRDQSGQFRVPLHVARQFEKFDLLDPLEEPKRTRRRTGQAKVAASSGSKSAARSGSGRSSEAARTPRRTTASAAAERVTATRADVGGTGAANTSAKSTTGPAGGGAEASTRSRKTSGGAGGNTGQKSGGAGGNTGKASGSKPSARRSRSGR